jgi:hypothetical protein
VLWAIIQILQGIRHPTFLAGKTLSYDFYPERRFGRLLKRSGFAENFGARQTSKTSNACQYRIEPARKKAAGMASFEGAIRVEP